MTELQFAPLAPDDTDALQALLARAFAFPAADASGWFDAAGRDNIRVVRRDGRVEGGCMVLPMGQYFGGRAVPIGGIAAVGVRTDARRRGIASRLMSEVLHELHHRGVPCSTLYASNAALYRRAGYQPAGARFSATIRPREIDASDRGGVVRDAGPDDAAMLHAMYAGAVRHRNGHLDRSRYIWDRLHGVRFGVPAHGLVLLDERGVPEGYLFWRQFRRELFHHVEVTDWVATTPAAHRRLWSTLSDLRTMVEDMRCWTAPHDPMLLAVPDPRLELRHEENWMLRLVDVAGAIRARGFAEALQLRVVLRVHDDVLAANDGSFTIIIDGGAAEVERGGTPELELDVRALAAIYSGFVSPFSLAALGAVRGNPSALGKLGLAFGDGAPWMPEIF